MDGTKIQADINPSTGWPDFLSAPDGLNAIVERRGVAIYAIVLLALIGLFTAGAWLFTLEADEAWILMSASAAFGVSFPDTSALANPTVSTGGVYLLVHGLLALTTSSLFVHRAVSLIAGAGFLLLVYRALRGLNHPPVRAAAGTSLAAATPGFVLQAGLAMGEILAVPLLVAAILHWAKRGNASAREAMVTGLLLGLACATRINCVTAVAGLLASVLVPPRLKFSQIQNALIAVVMAAAVTIASIIIYYSLALTSKAGDQTAYLSASTGIGNARRSVFQLLQYVGIFESYMPTFIVAAISTGWLARHIGTESQGAQTTTSLSGALLLAGLAMLAAWVLVAPIPHLRYFWPALVCISLAGILLLLEWWRTASPLASLALHVAILATTATALLSAALAVTNGESLVLVYQASGSVPITPLNREHRFRATAEQRALADFIASQPEDTMFYTQSEPIGYPLTYLSGRTIRALVQRNEQDGRNQILLVQPADLLIWRFTPAVDRWLHRYTRPIFRRGDMIALRIAPGAPQPFSGTNDAG